MSLWIDEWVAKIDERTCDERRKLNGKFFRSDEGPTPPLHPDCRCERVAVDGINTGLPDWALAPYAKPGTG